MFPNVIVSNTKAIKPHALILLHFITAGLEPKFRINVLTQPTEQKCLV